MVRAQNERYWQRKAESMKKTGISSLEGAGTSEKERIPYRHFVWCRVYFPKTINHRATTSSCQLHELFARNIMFYHFHSHKMCKILILLCALQFKTSLPGEGKEKGGGGSMRDERKFKEVIHTIKGARANNSFIIANIYSFF